MRLTVEFAPSLSNICPVAVKTTIITATKKLRYIISFLESRAVYQT
jgi:hypothetical protein